MIVTGAFFADQAEDDGGKLSVVGGVWDFIPVPAGLEAVAARLVVLIQTSPDDYGRENVVSVDTTTPSGIPAGRTELVIQELGRPAENRYFHFNVPFQVAERGRFAFSIAANGEHPLSLGVEVRAAQSS